MNGKTFHKLMACRPLARAGVMIMAAVSIAGLSSCKWFGGKSAEQSEQSPSTPRMTDKVDFNADSAYSFIEEQVAFGPRVPGTDAHRQCTAYIIDRLKKFDADTILTQSFTATAYNGDRLPLTNIMGRFNLSQPDRIMLIAHYDTRPWADREKRAELANTPVLGANDGGSGVGVLLELARQFSLLHPEVGVDMLFTDGEDYGNSAGWSGQDSTWCLGTQHWVENLPADYRARLPRYGILLDMVGGEHARFNREYISDIYASPTVDRVWGIAEQSGHSRFFVNKKGGSVVDDHLFINNAGIPTADIIDVDNEATGNFPSTWHTADDNMEGISRETLKAVGQTVANVIYYEKAQ